ncbi:hypothetical protein BMS3Abin03_02433 [bacterium BMS3Abin03]|nr:hypothetical protein BMS3Abin03_02433 [bacterium BMS3Abin03]
MTLHIIIGVLIGFGLYILYSKRSRKVNLQSASNQHVHDHQSHNDLKQNDSDHNHKKGHGCCG